MSRDGNYSSLTSERSIMSEYMLHKKNSEIRQLKAEQAGLHRKIQELTQTVQALKGEIKILDQRKNTWQISSHFFNQRSGIQRKFDDAEAEFNLP